MPKAPKKPSPAVPRRPKPQTPVRLRVVLGNDLFLGPGKADLMEEIMNTGSISAAGRRLGMSYKRAWTLVETLNGYFAEPLVIKAPGGKTGGGALLTPLGQDVLKRYRRMVAACDKAIAADVAALRKRSAS